MRDVLEIYLPPGTNYNKMEQTYTLPNKSRIQVIQQAAGREQFQGARVRAAWIDEECPASQGGEEIFSEILARKKPGQNLDVFYTFTPLNGLDWSYRRLLDDESKDRYRNVEVFNATIWDAAKSHGGWYTDQEIEEIVLKYPEHERAARLEGKASVLAGSLYFNRHALNKCLDRCPKPVYMRLKRGALSAIVTEELTHGPLQVSHKPEAKHEYIVGVDPSGGVGRDSSVAVVFDRADLRCCAIYSANDTDPDMFGAEVVLLLGMYYNEALLVVESNNHGGTVLSQLKGRYSNLFVRRDWDKHSGGIMPEYGFRTDTKTRPRVLDALARALREEQWTPPEQVVREMMTMVIKEDMKVEALHGYFDDAAMAAGVGLCIHYEQPQIQYPSKSQYEIKVRGGQPDGAWMAA